MLTGGGVLLLLSLLMGERWGAPSAASLWALAYLTVFGSLLAYSAYMYLVAHTRPALATSYAYVNPVVAVALGVGLGEPPVLWVHVVERRGAHTLGEGLHGGDLVAVKRVDPLVSELDDGDGVDRRVAVRHPARSPRRPRISPPVLDHVGTGLSLRGAGTAGDGGGACQCFPPVS